MNVIGCIAVILAIAGVFLPLLPTTPFLLLASACFLRSSEKLHRRLMNNRLFGPYLENIQRNRGIPLKGKIFTLILLWGSIFLTLYRLDRMVVEIILIVIAATASAWILKMKTLHQA